jgi:hypothetical protein
VRHVRLERVDRHVELRRQLDTRRVTGQASQDLQLPVGQRLR